MRRFGCALVACAVAATVAIGAAASAEVAKGATAVRAAAPTAGGVDAEVLGVSVVPRSHGRRAVIAELRTDERITVSLRVIRYQSVLARSKVFRMGPGRWFISMPLSASVSAGRARVVVRLEDRAGHVAAYRQPIQIPGRGA
jgi:hypothetical protein